MPSTITRPVAGRVTNQEAEAFKAQAARGGLTPSQAVATLVRGALLVAGVEKAAEGPR